MTQSSAQLNYSLIAANVDAYRLHLNTYYSGDFLVVQWLFGNRELMSMNKKTPCVVCCRTSDPIKEGEQRGQGKMHRTLNSGFVFHVFGVDDGEAEYLLKHLIRGINVVCGVSAAFNQDVEWHQSVIEDRYEYCRLFANIETPVIDQIKTVKLTTEEQVTIETSTTSPGDGTITIIEPRNV